MPSGQIENLIFKNIHYRTKVECAGQCLLTSSCSAFRYYGTSSCQLLNSTYLYRNKNDVEGTEIYMEDTKWDQRGKHRCKIIFLSSLTFVV